MEQLQHLISGVILGVFVLLPLANPLTTVVLMISLSGGMTVAEREDVARRAAMYVFAIMMVAFFAGKAVMATFGISIPGLRIAGGMIVAFIGFRMLFPHDPDVRTEENDTLPARRANDIAFVPLAMPSTAGPGTIAMIISMAATVGTGEDVATWVVHTSAVFAFLSVSLILWVSLRSSNAIMRVLGEGRIEAISRLMGFLLVCMGVQFIINGVQEIVMGFLA